jgi:hypothetical protein
MIRLLAHPLPQSSLGKKLSPLLSLPILYVSPIELTAGGAGGKGGVGGGVANSTEDPMSMDFFQRFF